MEKFKRVTLFFLTFLAFDFCAGRLYTAFGVPKPVPDPVRVSSSAYHHGFNPNAESMESWGGSSYKLMTNSLGLRDFSKRNVELKKTGRRILFVGDSFTEGIGVDYEETFAGQTALKLKPLGIEVLDAGVSSYSPVLYLRKTAYLLETLGLEADEVFVFIDTSDVIDEINYAVNPGKGSLQISALKDNSILVRVLFCVKDYFGKKSHSETKRPEDRRLQDLWSFDDSVYSLPTVQEGLRLERSHMDQLYALLEKHHIKMTVAVYPWPVQILSVKRDQKQESVWKEWCREKNVRFIDFFPAFMQGSDPKETVSRYYLREDIHWNRAGHKRVADLLWQETNGFQISSSSDS